jgi:hypothetical protein
LQDPIPTAAHLRDGYVVEIDGQFNSEYGSITAALSAGLRLRRKDGGHEVRVLDAQERAQERAPETRQPPEFHWWMTLDEREGWAAEHVPTVS